MLVCSFQLIMIENNEHLGNNPILYKYDIFPKKTTLSLYKVKNVSPSNFHKGCGK